MERGSEMHKSVQLKETKRRAVSRFGTRLGSRKAERREPKVLDWRRQIRTPHIPPYGTGNLQRSPLGSHGTRRYERDTHIARVSISRAVLTSLLAAIPKLVLRVGRYFVEVFQLDLVLTEPLEGLLTTQVQLLALALTESLALVLRVRLALALVLRGRGGAAGRVGAAGEVGQLVAQVTLQLALALALELAALAARVQVGQTGTLRVGAQSGVERVLLRRLVLVDRDEVVHELLGRLVEAHRLARARVPIGHVLARQLHLVLLLLVLLLLLLLHLHGPLQSRSELRRHRAQPISVARLVGVARWMVSRRMVVVRMVRVTRGDVMQHPSFNPSVLASSYGDSYLPLSLSVAISRTLALVTMLRWSLEP